MAKIYLAARYSRREELLAYRADLEAMGHTVTSRWLNGSHQIGDEGLSAEGTREERERFALEDWNDLYEASHCITFTEEPRSSNSRGGMWVEMGAALAWRKAVVIVGPSANVFCCLPDVERFDDWAALLDVYGWAHFEPLPPSLEVTV